MGWFSIVAAAIAGSWIWQWLSMRKRTAAIGSMATELGLRPWPDDSPPHDLSLEGTPFENWTRLFNIYEGKLRRKQVAILDFRRRVGRSSWSRTIIAVKTTDDVFANKPFELEARRVGD
jgi:hypothetical protein